MFCIKCGQQLEDGDSFCCMCGHSVNPAAPEEPTAIDIPPEPEVPAGPKPKQRAAVISLVLIFLVGLVVFLLFPTGSGPAQDAAMPWFSVEDGVLYFDQSLYTGSSTLVVPESISGQTVIAVSDGCFASCNNLADIQLPNTVSTIGSNAFSGCTDLRGIKLPESLTSIGSNAFSNCSNLEAVCIPYSLEAIGNDPFTGCSKLMYFFYPGPAEDWYDLPLGTIPENSYVYCADGLRPAK